MSLDNKNYVLILAGGSGHRFKHKQKKQFFSLNTKPIFIHSLLSFTEINIFSKIVLVYSQIDHVTYLNYLKEYNLADKIELVVGGASRINSTNNGLSYLKQFANYSDNVLIHDAARPFVKKEDILSIIDELKNVRAVTLGYPINDTIKRSDDNKIITSNVNRDNLWGILTPQGFKFGVIYEAHNKLIKDSGCHEIFTDDTEIVRNAGIDAKIIHGNKWNIKITRPEDIEIANLIANLPI